jgi:hypothetical protein
MMGVCTITTELFLSSARKKAQKIAESIFKLFDNALDKKSLSLRVAFWRPSVASSRLQVVPATGGAAFLASGSPEQQRNYVNSRHIGS